VRRWAEAETEFQRAMAMEGFEQSQKPLAGLEKVRAGIAFSAALAEAVALLEARRWSEAETAFQRAMAITGFEQAPDALSGLEKARAGAARAAFDEACSEGDDHLVGKRWTDAAAAFGRALKAIPTDVAGRAGAGAAHARLGAATAQAEDANVRGDWASVEKIATEALGGDGSALPASAGALIERLKALRAEAEEHLPLSWRLVATLDGREVPATITIGEKTWTAPQHFTVESGLRYTAEFRYEADGRAYSARTTRGACRTAGAGGFQPRAGHGVRLGPGGHVPHGLD